MKLNPLLKGLTPSATLAINEKSAELERSGKRIYRWGLGQSPFPVPECVVEALRENAHQKDYLPVQGLFALREGVAAHFSAKYHTSIEVDDVLIGPGSKELLYLLQLAFAGDLLLPNPGWVSYAPQARITGQRVHWLPTQQHEGWRLSPEVLESAIIQSSPRRPMLLLNYPNNPTGMTLPEEDLQALARVARKYGVLIISDEIYGELHHEGMHRSISEFYPEGTIVCSGLSKWCGAGGWRLGLSLFPREQRAMLKTVMSVASETFTSVSAPIQFAAVRAYAGGDEISTYIYRSRRILRATGRHLKSVLASAGFVVDEPEGSFYLFPKCTASREVLKRRKIEDSTSFCQRLLEETGIAVLPGHVFGRSREELSFRLSYVNFDGAAALQGVSQKSENESLKEDFLRKYCPMVCEAAEILCDWLPAH